MKCILSFISSPLFQNIILTLTFVAAFYVGQKQNEINKNIKETSIRPVILRTNIIPAWSDLRNGTINGDFFAFKVQRNIATNIKGYLILNKKKYNFLFGYSIGKVDSNGKVSVMKPDVKTMGWIELDAILTGMFDETSSEDVNLSNEICLTYQDIDGTEYFTKEDKDFIQTSGKNNASTKACSWYTSPRK